MSPKISLFDAVVFAFRTILDNVRPFFLIMLFYLISFALLLFSAAAVVLTQAKALIGTYLTSPAAGAESLQLLIAEINKHPAYLVLAIIILMLGMIMVSATLGSIIYLSKRAYEGGELTTDDAMQGARRGLKLFLLSLVTMPMIIVGLALLLVPGLYLIIRLAYTPFIMVCEQLSIIDTIKKSWQVTQGQAWTIVGFYLFFYIAMSMHTAGTVFFIPFFFAAGTHLYKKSTAR